MRGTCDGCGTDLGVEDDHHIVSVESHGTGAWFVRPQLLCTFCVSRLDDWFHAARLSRDEFQTVEQANPPTDLPGGDCARCGRHAAIDEVTLTDDGGARLVGFCSVCLREVARRTKGDDGDADDCGLCHGEAEHTGMGFGISWSDTAPNGATVAASLPLCRGCHSDLRRRPGDEDADAEVDR